MPYRIVNLSNQFSPLRGETEAGRAGLFLEFVFAGASSRDKRIANTFGVHRNTAARMRAGDSRSWNPVRFQRAVALWGEKFKTAVWPPPADELNERIARLEAAIAELRAELTNKDNRQGNDAANQTWCRCCGASACLAPDAGGRGRIAAGASDKTAIEES